MKTSIRRSGVMVALAAFLFVGAIPVLADKPSNFSFSTSFDAVDPCTGLPHVVTIFFDIYEHVDHKNNFVAHVIRTGDTSDGYELFSGHEVVVGNKNVYVYKFKDMWRSDDGRMFKVVQRFTFNSNQDEVKIDTFEIRCIRG